MARQTVLLNCTLPVRVVVNVQDEVVERVEVHPEDTLSIPGYAVHIPGTIGEENALKIAHEAPWPQIEWRD